MKYPREGLANVSVTELAWLEGVWQGEKDGEYVEEQWSGAVANSLMGMFRWVRDASVRFYELMTIELEANEIVFRLKHFNPGLVGWEEREHSLAFVLVSLQPREAIFAKRGVAEPLWMVYRMVADDQLVVFFESEHKEPAPGDLFRFTRQQGSA